MNKIENSKKNTPLGIIIHILIAILNALATLFGSTTKIANVVLRK